MGKARPRNRAAKHIDRVGDSLSLRRQGVSRDEIRDDQTEHHHGQERIEKRPPEADECVPVAHMNLAPHQQKEEVVVRGQFRKIKERRAKRCVVFANLQFHECGRGGVRSLAQRTSLAPASGEAWGRG
jgi:hypothetical protein